jgi:DNA-directed RNA polymerase specialized sigma24 family protein
VLLHQVEGLDSVELAKTLGRTEPEIERVLEYARRYLRQRLIEAGCHFY